MIKPEMIQIVEHKMTKNKFLSKIIFQLSELLKINIEVKYCAKTSRKIL